MSSMGTSVTGVSVHYLLVTYCKALLHGPVAALFAGAYPSTGMGGTGRPGFWTGTYTACVHTHRGLSRVDVFDHQ